MTSKRHKMINKDTTTKKKTLHDYKRTNDQGNDKKLAKQTQNELK